MENSDIAVLSLYCDEWKYRHENFWKRLIQFSIIIFFTTTLPITFRVFSDLKLPDVPLKIFPTCGICFTILFLLFCLSENGRLVAISKTIDRLRVRISPNYTKDSFSLCSNAKVDKIVSKFPFFHWRIGTWLPIVLSIIQIILAFYVLHLIDSGLLSL